MIYRHFDDFDDFELQKYDIDDMTIYGLILTIYALILTIYALILTIFGNEKFKL